MTSKPAIFHIDLLDRISVVFWGLLAGAFVFFWMNYLSPYALVKGSGVAWPIPVWAPYFVGIGILVVCLLVAILGYARRFEVDGSSFRETVRGAVTFEVADITQYAGSYTQTFNRQGTVRRQDLHLVPIGGQGAPATLKCSILNEKKFLEMYALLVQGGMVPSR
ncbi:MAG: hypothetical protein FWD63_06470 [Propionibacteriaceae bacterium]|nr:hypothetical protein [Propionibacteriaceae bacterium]